MKKNQSMKLQIEGLLLGCDLRLREKRLYTFPVQSGNNPWYG